MRSKRKRTESDDSCKENKRKQCSKSKRSKTTKNELEKSKTSRQTKRVVKNANKEKLTTKKFASKAKGCTTKEATKKTGTNDGINKEIVKQPNEKELIEDFVKDQAEAESTETPDRLSAGNCRRQDTGKEVEAFNFKGKTWMSDITFLVQGKRIYCSKAVLAMFSPVFRSMFSGKNYRQKGTLVELPGKEYESFLDFLKCIFPNVSHPDITKQNVFKILSLAYEYNVGNLLQQCEEYLIKSIEVREPCINSLMRVLTKAKQYKLNGLKDFCIKILTEKDPFAVQASGEKLGLQDTLHYVQGEIILKKHGILKNARSDLEKTCRAFEMSDVLQAFGGFEQAESAKLELSLKIDKEEELSKQSACSETVCLNGLRFSAHTVIYTATNRDHDVSYLNLYLKCTRDATVGISWSCDVRAKCILKMRTVGRRHEQITKTKTFTFSENHIFFTGLKTKLGSSVGKNAGCLQGKEFEAVVYFLANVPQK